LYGIFQKSTDEKADCPGKNAYKSAFLVILLQHIWLERCRKVARKRTPKKLDDLFGDDSQAAGFFETEPRPALHRTARVVAVPLSQCLPDRFQSRVILPPDIKLRFFGGEMDCYQTAGNLLEAANYDLGIQSQVERLLVLGENIFELGQIEPATGSWIQGHDGSPIFAIEVGERRFWALALAAVQRELEEEPVLRVIEESQFSRARQISENIQREGNTAVDRARAIAGLILLQLDIHPDVEMEDDVDYFRQVLDIKRLPNGTWPPIEKQMQLSRPVLERHLHILRLPSELIYLAKLYDVPEGRLREIVGAHPEAQKELLLLAIEEDLTALELKERVEQQKLAVGSRPRRKTRLSTHKKAASRIRSFLRLTRRGDFSRDYEMVATEFSATAQDADELLEAADHLEEQANWLRVMHERRQ
jgi:hypothetical protein